MNTHSCYESKTKAFPDFHVRSIHGSQTNMCCDE